MITTQTRIWTVSGGWSRPSLELPGEPQLVFVFGDRELVAKEGLFDNIKQFYPEAYILTGSTSGNILNDTVTDKTVTVSALHFEKTKIWYAETTVANVFDSQNVGKKLAEFLPTEDLVHSFILSDGLSVNGSELVRSVNEYLPESVTVTGGLAGDGELFKETLVGCNDTPEKNKVVLIGFYSKSLKVGYASEGGWHSTGSKFTVTKSKGNVLYELDGEPALDVYRSILGENVVNVPGNALLHPLEVEQPGIGKTIRAVMSTKDADGSLTFAGDIPEGVVAEVAGATEDAMIESARKAAEESVVNLNSHKAQFALLVSCVARRLVLKERSAEEILAAHKAIGQQAVVHGFYSYGELCPKDTNSRSCLMHNQTMTITTFTED